MSAVLLDTCALIWVSEGRALTPTAERAIKAAALEEGVFVSPVSAWEIGLLAARGRFTVATTQAAVERWFRLFLARAGVHSADFTAATALQSASLPGFDHPDPADRFLIATSRVLGLPLVTSDRTILAYADRGHLDCIPC